MKLFKKIGTLVWESPGGRGVVRRGGRGASRSSKSRPLCKRSSFRFSAVNLAVPDMHGNSSIKCDGSSLNAGSSLAPTALHGL